MPMSKCPECGVVRFRSETTVLRKPIALCRRCVGLHSSASRGDDGRSYTPEWRAWKAMHDRCSNPQHAAYARYGGRGIKVCKRWGSFDNFLADMGPRPSDAHSLDRKNNDGDYKPSNCRWATSEEQNRNTRANRHFTANGRTQLLTDWAKELGTTRATLWLRIRYYGWSVEKACTTPIAPRTRRQQ